MGFVEGTRGQAGGGPGSAVPFTRAISLQPFICFLEAGGAPVERLLKHAGIPGILLEQPEALLPLHLGHRFLAHAVRTEGIDHLGLSVGRLTLAYDLGVFGKQLRKALTIYDYLRTGIQLIGSVTSGQRFWLQREGDRVRFGQYCPGHQGLGHGHGEIYVLVIILSMLRRFTHPAWKPDEISLLAGTERLLDQTDSFFDTRIVTGQSHSSFTMPVALLQRPIPPEIRGSQPRSDQPYGRQPALPGDLPDSIEQIIASLLPNGCPGVQLVAEVAGMSIRTLQRRLGDAGISYSRILHRTRIRLAAKWLAETTMPVTEIANSLGYSDTANFTRSFRRKAGVPPSQYRLLVKQQRRPGNL